MFSISSASNLIFAHSPNQLLNHNCMEQPHKHQPTLILRHVSYFWGNLTKLLCLISISGLYAKPCQKLLLYQGRLFLWSPSSKLFISSLINKVDYCQTSFCILCSGETELLFRVRTIQTILAGKRQKQIEKFRAITCNASYIGINSLVPYVH